MREVAGIIAESRPQEGGWSWNHRAKVILEVVANYNFFIFVCERNLVVLMQALDIVLPGP